MAGDAPEAPAPDPQIGAAALKQAETGQQWLDFAKDAFKVSEERQKEIDSVTRQIGQQQIKVGDQQFEWAKQDRARYDSTFKPIEDQFIKEATDYASPEKQAEAAATARSDVLSNAAAQREAAQRDAASMGINPNSGRFAGTMRTGDLGVALQTAGAENSARTFVKDKGLALKADVANMGRGLPAQSAQATALGLNAGTGAAGLYGAANQQYIASTGIMGQGFRGAMAGYAGQADALNKQYATQMDGYRTQVAAEGKSSAGIGQLLGTVGGALITKLPMFSDENVSDENVKENKTPLPEGLGLSALRKMRVEEWKYKDGVEDEGRHIGTYAQDFQAATGKGDGKSIPVIDAIGVTMKAVQDLDKTVLGLAGVVEKLAKAKGGQPESRKGGALEAKPATPGGRNEQPATPQPMPPGLPQRQQAA